MTRHLALLLLSASLTYCMETKETVQRMVMVRTTGSDIKPEAKGFIYKRESDGPPKVIKMANDEVLKKLSKVYVIPQAFDAPIPYAAGPFYNKEEDSTKAGSKEKVQVIPLFENLEDSKEYKEYSAPAAAKIPRGFAGAYAPQSYEDFSNDFTEYLVSLGYHDDFYRVPGGDYGALDHIDDDAVKISPSHYRYAESFDNDAGKANSEKYEIHTLGTTEGSKKTKSKKNTNSPAEYKQTNDSEKSESLKSEKLNSNFRNQKYNDGYKNDDDQSKEVKTVGKYDGDFYDYKKDDDADDIKAGIDFYRRFAGGYDYADSEDSDDEKAVAEDLNGQVAEELRDCCYEEKPGDATTDADIRVERGKNYIYKIGHQR